MTESQCKTCRRCRIVIDEDGRHTECITGMGWEDRASERRCPGHSSIAPYVADGDMPVKCSHRHVSTAIRMLATMDHGTYTVAMRSGFYLKNRRGQWSLCHSERSDPVSVLGKFLKWTGVALEYEHGAIYIGEDKG